MTIRTMTNSREWADDAPHLFEGHVARREEEQGDFGDAQRGAALGAFAQLPRGRPGRPPVHEAVAQAQQAPCGSRLRLLQRPSW